jgi:hypothetical protein
MKVRSAGIDVDVAAPFARIENSLRNEIGRVQSRKPDVRRLREEHLAQLRDQRIGRIGPASEIREARIARKILALDRQVALKVMLPQFARNETAKTRFLREAASEQIVITRHGRPAGRLAPTR